MMTKFGKGSISGSFYKTQAPSYNLLHKMTRELLVEGIAVNSGYNSQVLPPAKPGEQRQQVCSLYVDVCFRTLFASVISLW